MRERENHNFHINLSALIFTLRKIKQIFNQSQIPNPQNPKPKKSKEKNPKIDIKFRLTDRDQRILDALLRLEDIFDFSGIGNSHFFHRLRISDSQQLSNPKRIYRRTKTTTYDPQSLDTYLRVLLGRAFTHHRHNLNRFPFSHPLPGYV